MTYTRPAKCSDCKFLKEYQKRKHRCENPDSPENLKTRYKKNLVCEKWIYLYQ